MHWFVFLLWPYVTLSFSQKRKCFVVFFSTRSPRTAMSLERPYRRIRVLKKKEKNTTNQKIKKKKHHHSPAVEGGEGVSCKKRGGGGEEVRRASCQGACRPLLER